MAAAVTNEVQAAPVRDDDLAVHDDVERQRREQRVLELGDVTIERAKIAALDEERGASAEHDGAESVPLGLVEIGPGRRQIVGQLREHGLDRRRDREIACRLIWRGLCGALRSGRLSSNGHRGSLYHDLSQGTP